MHPHWEKLTSAVHGEHVALPPTDNLPVPRFALHTVVSLEDEARVSCMSGSASERPNVAGGR